MGEGQTRQVKKGDRKVCKGEDDAFKAGGDNIDSVTTVASDGRAKSSRHGPRVDPKRDGGRGR
jgi:hypothetical protein